MAKRKSKKKTFQLRQEVISLAIIATALIALFQFGFVGRSVATVTFLLVGQLHWVLWIGLIVWSVYQVMGKATINWTQKQIIVAILLTVVSFTLAHFVFVGKMMELYDVGPWRASWQALVTDSGVVERTNLYGSGLVGATLYSILSFLFDRIGTFIVSLILLLIAIVLGLDREVVRPTVEAVKSSYAKLKMTYLERKKAVPSKKEKAQPIISTIGDEEVEESLAIEPPRDVSINHFTQGREPATVAPVEQDLVEEQEEDVEEFVLEPSDDEEESPYQLPVIHLLDDIETADQSSEIERIKNNAQKLEETFKSFNVAAHVSEIHLGPAVTKYEILPATGVKVSRIVGLTDDLALALAARDIRMEAPIPGKSAIGIEVPNQTVSAVSLKEVLEEDGADATKKLQVALGRDVTGKAVLTELNKMPHVLVAGSTGSGKSVCINGIIISILMRAKPHEVKMMMIDPKMVELNVYNGIPHLLAPVVTDPRKAAQALQKVVSEMERRYELFSHTGTRNIEGYNAQLDRWNEENDEKHPRMPYIVVIVDELADLMMVASNDVEEAIMRLAQMARAAGIHLIIATQRPSVDVITGIIKANIPSRIAFAVSSAVDSRTILDGSGAEKLLGRGDMLFLPSGASKPTRVQGAFVSDQEVERIVDHCIEQQKAQYEESMIPTEIEEVDFDEEVDEKFDEAIEIVLEQGQASISMLQRRLRVGYSRAARIVDQMEERGIVGPSEGSKPRKLLIDSISES
ncbi:DNA translocase FtsK [Savagea faecisuis]|uniref:DNA translocase FtsK n=1 Tax=Savagea faecisuis TaxID=1274803 RepID=A0ABW3GW01_9BACL